MRPQPPVALERVVGWFIPPACREEVLGDLCERYTGPGQYVALALFTIPFVIASRIRRTADVQVLLMEALLIYASSLLVALYADRSLLTSRWGLLRLAVPTAVTIAVLVIGDAWTPPSRRALNLISALVYGICIGCVSAGLPVWLTVVAACASLLLVSTVRIVFRQPDQPRAVTGPPLRTAPAPLSRITKGLLVAVGAACLAIFLTSAGMKPGGVAIVISLLALMWGYSKRDRLS